MSVIRKIPGKTSTIKFRDRKGHKTEIQEDKNGEISGGTVEIIKNSGFEVRKTTMGYVNYWKYNIAHFSYPI